MTWGLFHHSHWQGAGPDQLIATGSRDLCEAGENMLSTCSFCTPGRTRNYDVGTCYAVRRVRYEGDAPAIPADAAEWERHDWSRWLADAEGSS